MEPRRPPLPPGPAPGPLATAVELAAAAARPQDLRTLAFAGAILGAPARGEPGPWVLHGLDFAQLDALLRAYFPALAPRLAAARRRHPRPVAGPAPEFDDLVALLGEHAAVPEPATRWLAHALATACERPDHLWQDMGLPSRGVLSALIAGHFPALAAANAQDMKWKKFLYLRLCERAELRACAAPSCAACAERPRCFAPETGVPRHWAALAAAGAPAC